MSDNRFNGAIHSAFMGLDEFKCDGNRFGNDESDDDEEADKKEEKKAAVARTYDAPVVTLMPKRKKAKVDPAAGPENAQTN